MGMDASYLYLDLVECVHDDDLVTRIMIWKSTWEGQTDQAAECCDNEESSGRWAKDLLIFRIRSFFFHFLLSLSHKIFNVLLLQLELTDDWPDISRGSGSWARRDISSSSRGTRSSRPCWGWSCSCCTSTSPAWASLMSSILSFCQHPVELCQAWWCSEVGHHHHHHQQRQCQQHHHLDHLVHKHAGEDGDKDADNGETEHCAKTRVDRPVDHLAVWCGREHKPIGGRCWILFNAVRSAKYYCLA